MIARRGDVEPSFVFASDSVTWVCSPVSLAQAASAAEALRRPTPFTKNLRVICVSMIATLHVLIFGATHYIGPAPIS
jgi:hypothetical protein